MCRFPGFPECTAAFSPLTRVIPGQATPELCKLQADLAARHSFREAARLLNALTPCARQNHTTIRNRLASVADGLETQCAEIQKALEVQPDRSEMTVFLDSAYVRSRPEYQRRNFEVVVGSIESKTGSKRRFGLSLAGADHPLECLKSNLKAAGWRPGSAVTVLSDGDPALPRLVRNATNGNVKHILDWSHICHLHLGRPVMTSASTHIVRRPGAILSRLLLVLTLVLFGLPQGHADGIATIVGPTAQSTVEQALGIPSAQRHLLRAQLPDNASPDGVVPGGVVQAGPFCSMAMISPAPHQPLLPIAIHILPPARGPPAACRFSSG